LLDSSLALSASGCKNIELYQNCHPVLCALSGLLHFVGVTFFISIHCFFVNLFHLLQMYASQVSEEFLMIPGAKDVLEVLESHFEKNGWPLNLNQKKLRSRHRITVNEAFPACYVVEVERHRPILGTAYSQGLPMSAYETYQMRYAVNFSDATVRELSEIVEGVEFDFSRLVGETLDHERFFPCIEVSENGYVVLDKISMRSGVATSLQDVKVFMLSFVERNVDYYSARLEDLESLSSERREEINKRLRNALEKAVFHEACELWNSRDD